MDDLGAWYYELQYRQMGPDWLARLSFKPGSGPILSRTVRDLNISGYKYFDHKKYDQEWYICSCHYDVIRGNLLGIDPKNIPYAMFNCIILLGNEVSFERIQAGHSLADYRDSEMAVFTSLLKEEKLVLADWSIKYGHEGVYSLLKDGRSKNDLGDYLKFLNTFYP